MGLLALVAYQDVEPAPDSDGRDGYKAHLAVDPETGLFTAVTLRPGAGAAHQDAAVAADLLAGENAPVIVLGDAAYGTAAALTRAASDQFRRSRRRGGSLA